MRRFITCVIAATALMACGDSDETGTVSDTAGSDTTDTTTGTDTGDTTGADTVAPNACGATMICSSGVCRSGVCVADPPAASVSKLTDPSTNVATTMDPDLSCVGATGAAAPAPPVGPATATLYGAVDRFGSGRKTLGMQVDVLAAADFDPVACESLAPGDTQRDCYRGHGTVLGTAISAAPPTPTSLPTTCTDNAECPLGYECFDPDDLGGECEEQFGLYEIANIPTNTELIIRVHNTDAAFESRWHDTYTFNVYLFADRVGDDGRIQYDGTMVSQGQWLLTTNAVLLPEIELDEGAVGGRVRDCHSAAREGWPISEVSLDLATPAQGVVFFNDLEEDTVPLVDRVTSNILGRYAALKIPLGWNAIAGSARVGNQVVSLGSVPVYVVPNALSLVGFPGRQPFWKQQ